MYLQTCPLVKIKFSQIRNYYKTSPLLAQEFNNSRIIRKSNIHYEISRVKIFELTVPAAKFEVSALDGYRYKSSYNKTRKTLTCFNFTMNET